MRRCGLPAVMCMRRRGVRAKLVLMWDSRALFCHRSPNCWCPGVPREKSDRLAVLVCGPWGIGEQRRESDNICSSVETPGWADRPASRRRGRLRDYFRLPDGFESVTKGASRVLRPLSGDWSNDVVVLRRFRKQSRLC
jgi:hypothetical protein